MSFEILPNWHPFFVHFTIALIVVGSVLYLLANLFPFQSKWRQDMSLVAVWSLFLAGGFTVITLGAGLHAYLTVGHDGASHQAMVDHRNWGLVTGVLLFFSLGFLWFFSAKSMGRLLISIMLVLLVSSLLMTGYKGSHLVYRFGLGVQSLPSSLGSHEDHHRKTKENKTHSDAPHNHDGHSH